jgi:hypothetical protein
MARLTSRLISFTTTLCLGAGIHGLLHTKSATSRAFDQVRSEVTALPSSPVKPISEFSAESASRVSQEEIIRFPEIGNVRVRANEDFGKGLRLTFFDPKSGGELLTAYFGSSNWNWSGGSTAAESNPKLRFKAISIRGFPNPLIVGIAMNPGVSDSGWETAAVGVVNGELQRLTYETMETSNEGGFFFGDLGPGLGLGAAQWDFVWGEDEGHMGPHKYEVKLSKWNGRRFEWFKVFRTTREYEFGEDALRAHGYHFVDVKGMFPDWPGVDSP